MRKIKNNVHFYKEKLANMDEIVSNMKNINLLDKTITIKSAMKESNVKELEQLADELKK